MRSLRFLLVLMAALVFMACGGSDGSPTQEPLAPVADLEADKATAREAVRSTFGSLPHQTPTEDNELLAAFMRTQPIFSNVQSFPGLIMAEFPDGELYYVMNNLPYLETEDTSDFRADQAEDISPLASNDATPQSVDGSHCVLVNAFSNDLPNQLLGGLQPAAADSLGSIARMLQSKSFSLSGPSLSNYNAFRSSFQSVDVLVWCGHSAGGPGGKLLLTLPFENIPAVENRSDPDVQGPPADRILLRGDTVVGQVLAQKIPGLTPEHLVQLHPSYAVTSSWLKKYVHLNERSLCMITACGSDSDASIRQNLNPGTFVGWKGAPEISCIDAFSTQEAFFDVALSTNTLGLFDSEDPPRNDFQSVLTFLSQTGRTRLPAGSNSATHQYAIGTSTIPEAHGRPAIVSTLSVTGSGFLVPWIEEALAEGSMLTLTGSFGDDPGSDHRKVTLEDGTDLKVDEWTADQIVCTASNLKQGDRVRVTLLDHPGNLKAIKLSGAVAGRLTIHKTYHRTRQVVNDTEKIDYTCDFTVVLSFSSAQGDQFSDSATLVQPSISGTRGLVGFPPDAPLILRPGTQPSVRSANLILNGNSGTLLLRYEIPCQIDFTSVGLPPNTNFFDSGDVTFPVTRQGNVLTVGPAGTSSLEGLPGGTATYQITTGTLTVK